MIHTNTDSGIAEAAGSLLRGEISAIQTYDQALEKLAGSQQSEALKIMREDHDQARSVLAQYVEMSGSEPDENSGPWGAWAQLTMGTAKLFGEVAALKALKEGEEHGLKVYEVAMANENLGAVFKDEVASRLVPAQKRHIEKLNDMMMQ